MKYRLLESLFSSFSSPQRRRSSLALATWIPPLLLSCFLLAVGGDFVNASKGVSASSAHSSAQCRTFNEPGAKYERVFLSERHGHFSTPNFPAPFPLPFSGSWIINATGYDPDSYITLYLTQMYLTRGVQVVQYTFHNGTHATGRKTRHDEIQVLRSRPYSVSSIRIKAKYLEVQVDVHDLVNANLRVENLLVDVYGFNITYEIQSNNTRIRNDSCNAVNCTFNGHCYASHNYSHFQCSCLRDFFGPYCQYGPDCDPKRGINICKNGGICAYRSGHTVVRCSCPPHYNGSLCEFRRETIPSKECLFRFKLNCSHHCAMKDNQRAVCQCPTGYALKSDDVTCYPLHPQRILCEMDIAPTKSTNKTTRLLLGEIESALRAEVLKVSANLMTVGPVTFVQSSKIKFQLWSSETMVDNFHNWSSNRAEKQWIAAVNTTRALTHWIYLSDTGIQILNSTFKEVPALVIEWVRLDVRQARVREGYPFVVACKTNGSDRLVINWYKDGHLVDVQHSLRNMSIEQHPPDLRGYYISYLEIKKATASDRGEYECRATDWDQTVRSSVFLEVITPPILNLMPANPSVDPDTIAPNSSLILTCRDENDLARRTLNGTYTWFKNGQIIKRSSCDEVFEDLFPVGSLLKIHSIEHSTKYSCERVNEAGRSVQETLVSVLRPSLMCDKENLMGVDWHVTAVNATNTRFCPKNYVGVARRRCSLSLPLPSFSSVYLHERINASASSRGRWNLPDYTGCSHSEVNELNKEMKLLTLGYSVTSVSAVISKLWRHLNARLPVLKSGNVSQNVDSVNQKFANDSPALNLPGEGNAVVELLLIIERYLWKKHELLPSDFWITSAISYLEIVDALLSAPNYILPDGLTPVARFLQNHVVLLSRKLPCASTFTLRNAVVYISTRLANDSSAIEKHNSATISYKWIPSSLKLKGTYRSNQVVATPSFSLVNATPSDFPIMGPNLTETEFHINSSGISSAIMAEGQFVCVNLPFRSPNLSNIQFATWDLTSCKVELVRPSVFQCHCNMTGTTMLLFVPGVPQESTKSTLSLWIAIWFAASVSQLIFIITLVMLFVKWYYRRSLWSWLQIQSGVAFYPLSLVHFLPINRITNDLFWTYLLSSSIYWYMSTVVTMAWHSKTNRGHRLNGVQSAECLNWCNIRLIGFSFGLPLTLMSIHALLHGLSNQLVFKSWLSEYAPVSSILFVLAFSSMLLVIIAQYTSSLRRIRQFEKQNNKEIPAHLLLYRRRKCERCCLILVGICFFASASMIFDLHWNLLSVHCASAILNCLAVLAWSALMLTFSEDGRPLRIFWTKSHDSSKELENATILTESPQRTFVCPFSLNGPRNNNSRTESTVGAKTSEQIKEETQPVRSKRSKQIATASLPLLQRAGLGLDVQRAFGVDMDVVETQQHRPKAKNPTKSRVLIVDQVSNENSEQPNKPAQSLQPLTSSAQARHSQKDDSDSGLGPSGGSHIFVGIEKLTDAWKALCQIRLKFPHRMLVAWSGSFRSRHSTMSSITTDHGEGSSSVTTNETEVTTPFPDSELGLLYGLRRSRTRWVEDYGQPCDLESISQLESNSTDLKPSRGRCFIRCSPEKTHGTWNRAKRYEKLPGSSDQKLVPVRVKSKVQKSCERCWHNPETPACDLCRIAEYTGIQQPSGPIFIRAIVEKSPQDRGSSVDADSGDYLTMNAVGNLTVDSLPKEQHNAYYNLRMCREIVDTNEGRSGGDVSNERSRGWRSLSHRWRLDSESLSTVTTSTHPDLRRKISNGRIMKKHRQTLRNPILPSTQSLTGRIHRRLSHLSVSGAEILSHASPMHSV